jgi:hypothetical protein
VRQALTITGTRYRTNGVGRFLKGATSRRTPNHGMAANIFCS